MFKKIFFTLLFFGLMLGSFSIAKAQETTELNFFYSKTCGHCAQAREYLPTLEEKYPEVKVNQYEIVFDKDNQQLLVDFYKKYDVPENLWGMVPVFFTDKQYFIGFDDNVVSQLEGCLDECTGIESGQSGSAQEIEVPIIGKVDISRLSLPALTIILGGLDGFNPCAMWVLIFLIILFINMRSRKRMWLIGGTFILTSAVLYYLILAAWLNLFLAISYVNITRMIIGVLAVGVGVWQIKNFLSFRPGVCKVTDNEGDWQTKLKEKMKSRAEKIAVSPISLGIVLGTIALALSVNLVEFFCSAGIPAIYTKILAISGVGKLSYYLYLLLYTFIFMLDDIIVLSVAVITLSHVKVTEKYNYWATLIGGIIILILGLTLIFRPELLMFV